MVRKMVLLFIVALALLPAMASAQSTPTPVPASSSLRSGEIKIEGVVASLQNNVLVIGTQPIDVSEAVIQRGVVVGGFAEAFVTPTAQGAWIARRVELDRNVDEDDLNEVEIKGTATAVGADFVVIGGRRFDTSLAEVEGTIVAGAFVELELSLSNSGQWVVVEVNLDADDDNRDDRDDDNRGPGSGDDEDNSGPGNSHDGDRNGDDNSGPGNSDDDDHDDGDHRGGDNDGDNDDDDDNSGPGNSDDD
jgi:hypothetical protein